LDGIIGVVLLLSPGYAVKFNLDGDCPSDRSTDRSMDRSAER
jgi:hypothetical protein